MQETFLSSEPQPAKDPIESSLLGISRNIFVFLFGLLPLFFLPVAYIQVDYLKVMIVIAGVLLAVIFFSLSVLRSGRVRITMPMALFGLWAVAGATVLSALLSGDMRDAFIGDTLGVHTSVFVLLLAVVASAPLLIGFTKGVIMRLYFVLTVSAMLIGLFHLLRLLFGPEFLSFSVFDSLVSTPIGGWNDLALFFGLCILLSLVALEQLPLTQWGKGFFATVVAISLILLGIVNFTAVWVVLGLVSLIVLMYSLTKDRFSEKNLTLEGKKQSTSLVSVTLSVAVFIVSLVFTIGGGAVGGYISNLTGISYIEVRPSFEATMDITRSVFNENAFVGIGPNKFVDAWRLYKDPSINETVFWATDFEGANGYVTTFFATTGIVGIVAWIVFLALFVFTGFRMLFRTTHADRFWYFIGSSSFVAAAYLWGMSIIYIPGAAMLLLAAVFTATTFAAYTVLVQVRPFTFSIAANKRAGFVLVGVVMIVIVGTASALYYVGRHYSSVHTFGNALYQAQMGGDIAVIEEQIASAYATSQNEAYALQLASYQLSKMNALASLTELTAEQQQQLQASIQNGINAGLIATNADPSNPIYWSTLGSIYSVLASASVEGAQQKAAEAFAKSRSFDPNNPLYLLLEAQLNSRTGDLEGARARASEAINLKPNYTDALFFLTQIDIAEGNTEAAIATTQSIISLEPNNPARYYQLGVLQSAAGNNDAAIIAFEQAVALDPNYANARYFLALSYAQQDNREAALEQLQVVLDLNPGNASVLALMEQLRSGEPINVDPVASTEQVSEPESVSSTDTTVTTTEDPDTPLISPVNAVNQSGNQTEEVTEETQ